MLRMAFVRYRNKARALTIDLNSFRKSGDYGVRIRYNAKKRMFLAFKKYTTNFIRAKKFLRRAVHNSDLTTERNFFSHWKNEHNSEKSLAQK